MRKLTILMALATTLAASSGCSSCIGRCRNLFHKGSPCGTAMAAPIMGAPLAMGTPMSSAPMVMGGPMMSGPMCVEQAPMCMPVDQCMDPCADPCNSGMVTMGYGGGFPAAEGCNCAGGGTSTMAPMTTAPMTTAPGGIMVSPSPMGDQ